MFYFFLKSTLVRAKASESSEGSEGSEGGAVTAGGWGGGGGGHGPYGGGVPGPPNPAPRAGSVPFFFFATAWLSVRGAAAAPLRMHPPHINEWRRL